MSEWQPIETAPKDGTPILIRNGKYVAVAFWDTDASNYDGVDFEPYWAMDDGHEYFRALRGELQNPKEWRHIPK